MAGRLGPAKGKSFDGANVLGPWIVTPDELGDPADAQVEVRVNGETRAKGTTANMLFTFPQILAYASQDETIHAGEVFGSGTVGNCCGLEIGRFLESGDMIELHVDRIGVLRNRVIAHDAVKACRPHAPPHHRPLCSARKRRAGRSRARPVDRVYRP